jgi:MFS family permease
MTLTRKRWIILGAGCFINLCIGSIYSWSVFAAPIAEYLSALTGSVIMNLAVVFSVANGVGPITMILGGSINDRLGPTRVIRIGALLFGGGMFLAGFSRSPAMLILTYGLGVGFGNGMVYGCTVANSVKYFPDRPGLAGGLTTAAYGVSSTLMPPIANLLITNRGVTGAFKILGVAVFLIILTGSFFVARCPPGFVPEGWISPHMKNEHRQESGKKMLYSPVFYCMFLLLLCGAFSGLMIISQAASIAQKMIGMTMASAAVGVSILAFFNTLGRILAGFMSDKLGYGKTLSIVFIASIAGLLLLYFCETGTATRFYLGIICVGFAFGSVMGIFPGFTAAQFGTENNSVNYGIIFTGFAIAGYFGPVLMGLFYGKSESYRPAFLTAIGFAALGLGVTLTFRQILEKTQKDKKIQKKT